MTFYALDIHKKLISLYANLLLRKSAKSEDAVVYAKGGIEVGSTASAFCQMDVLHILHSWWKFYYVFPNNMNIRRFDFRKVGSV